MKIQEIDENLAQTQADDSLHFYSVNEPPFTLLGINKDPAGFFRMERTFTTQLDEGLQFLNNHTSGGRIIFSSNTSTIALRASVPSVETMPHMSLLGSSGFDLFVRAKGKFVYYKSFMPNYNDNNTMESTIVFPDNQMRELMIYFPLYQSVSSVEIGLDTSATSIPSLRYEKTLPIIFYGSSITQGGCAGRPANAYPAIIARDFDCNFINLGFSGSAKGEKEMANYIAKLSMSAFVLDYDHNAPNATHLENTLFPFYEIVRKSHPTIPIVFVSRPDYFKEREQDFSQRLVVKEAFTKAKKIDSLVWFVDGATLFEPKYKNDSTVDGRHPNDFGFMCMAKKIGTTLKKALNL